MKKFIKYFIYFILIFTAFSSTGVNAASIIDININNGGADLNLNTGNQKSENNVVNNNDHLNTLGTGDENLFQISTGGEKGLSQTFVNIAKSLKNVFFSIAGLYFLIMVIKLVFNDNTDEEVGKFKKGLVWISIGIIITQIAYSFVNVLYDNNISEGLANSFINMIVYPLISLLETVASFFFLAIAIYSFFRMVTAQGEEEKVTTGRMSILYSIIGFIVIKVARAVVDTIYGKVDCNNSSFLGVIEVSNSNCVIRSNLNGSVGILADVLNWANSLIGIVIIILIIYTGVQVIFSAGNEETLNKAKKSIIYIVLGILLLFINYLILTFFIIPESAI